MRVVIFLFFCSLGQLAFPLALSGQSGQLYGTIPAVLLRGNLKPFDYAFSLSSEINAISRTLGDRTFPAEVLNLNLESALAYDPNPNLNLAAAFLYRIRNPFSGRGIELRPWQQATLINRLDKYRLRNRLRLEERWVGSTDEGVDFDLRLRYRLSTDFPLEGERLDIREFYLNLSTETLFTLTAVQPLFYWESRTYVGLGYQLHVKKRLEFAFDFRSRKIDSLGNRRHTLFLRLLFIADLSN